MTTIILVSLSVFVIAVAILFYSSYLVYFTEQTMAFEKEGVSETIVAREKKWFVTFTICFIFILAVNVVYIMVEILRTVLFYIK